jgi:hypothetical protein
MVPAKIFPAVMGAALCLAGAAMAADYRADEFLNLDLSKAVLSPKPLGPPAEFTPVPVQAQAEVTKAKNDVARADVVKTNETAEARRRVGERKVAQHPRTLAARVPSDKPRGTARIRLAHRHHNPLDAQAFDTRIQTWPCKSGGICDWKQ